MGLSLSITQLAQYWELNNDQALFKSSLSGGEKQKDVIHRKIDR